MDNYNYDNFPELSVASINCNSLSMSVTSKSNQIKKIYGITKLNKDIIFLSDIRLCNKNLILASNDCSKIFISLFLNLSKCFTIFNSCVSLLLVSVDSGLASIFSDKIFSRFCFSLVSLAC